MRIPVRGPGDLRRGLALACLKPAQRSHFCLVGMVTKGIQGASILQIRYGQSFRPYVSPYLVEDLGGHSLLTNLNCILF